MLCVQLPLGNPDPCRYALPHTIEDYADDLRYFEALHGDEAFVAAAVDSWGPEAKDWIIFHDLLGIAHIPFIS